MRIPIITIILVYLLSILADLYILRDIRNYVRPERRKAWKTGFMIFAGLALVLITVSFCFPRSSVESDIIPLMWMLYTYATIFFAEVVYVICSAIGRIFVPSRRKRQGRRAVNYGCFVGMALGCVVFCTMWWGSVYTRNNIRINHVTFRSDRLPKAFDGYRVAQFSDLHTGTWGTDTAFVSRLVDSINACRPDLILFTGDIVNRRTSELAPFLKVLSRLKARHGVYSVLGNHDYGDYISWSAPAERDANNALLAAWERQMGWNLLNNDHRFIRVGNDSIALIGVENWGDPPFPQYGDLHAAYPRTGTRHLNDSTFKILLTHNPAHWKEEVRRVSNVDLTLSGHTHAMQMMASVGRWNWSPAVFRYREWGGMYEDEGTPMKLYVNIGAGEVGMPSRIGSAYPEITLFELKSTRK